MSSSFFSKGSDMPMADDVIHINGSSGLRGVLHHETQKDDCLLVTHMGRPKISPNCSFFNISKEVGYVKVLFSPWFHDFTHTSHSSADALCLFERVSIFVR